MTEKRHVVKVSIVGDEYTIRSDAEPEHTRAVAEYLDRTIRRILQGNPLLETHKAAMLAANHRRALSGAVGRPFGR